MAAEDGIERVIRPEHKVHAIAWFVKALDRGLPGGPVRVWLGREIRTREQNDKMWPMLRDLSQQVEWYGMKLSETDWKHLISALVYGTKIVPGIDGGFVALGKSTSQMTKKMFGEMIEAIYAFGAEHSVAWSEPAMRVYEEWQKEKAA